MIDTASFLHVRFMYAIGWIIGYIPLSFLVRVDGYQYINNLKHSAVIVSNHETLLDPYIITAILPMRYNLRWVAKQSMQSLKSWNKEMEHHYSDTVSHKLKQKIHIVFRAFSVFFAKNTGTIIIKYDESTVQRSVDILDKIERSIIGVFAAGTLRKRNKNAPTHSGFVTIARNAGVPIIPVMIKRLSFFHWKISISQPISSKDLHTQEYGITNKDKAVTIMNIVEQSYEGSEEGKKQKVYYEKYSFLKNRCLLVNTWKAFLN